METALLNFFVRDGVLLSTCDFNLTISENEVNIYEVVRVESAIPLFLNAHLKRFYDSAQLEHKVIDLHPELIRQNLKVLLDQNMLIFGNIKFLCRWKASGEQEFLAWVVPFFYPDIEQYKQGVCVETMFGERPNPNAKKVLSSLVARADAVISQNKCSEVVYVNKAGAVTEGSRSNLFFVQGGQLVTPGLSSVLPGVTRAVVMDLARENGISVVERNIPADSLPDYEACFLSGTSPRILPVKRLHDTAFDVKNPLMRFIMEAYDKRCRKEKEYFIW